MSNLKGWSLFDRVMSENLREDRARVIATRCMESKTYSNIKQAKKDIAGWERGGGNPQATMFYCVTGYLNNSTVHIK